MAAGLLHALLMGLAFPPIDLWPAAFLAPVPLIWIAIRAARVPPITTRRFRRVRSLRLPLAASLGILPLHVYEHQWVIDVSAFGYFPMVVGMSLFGGAFVWFLALVVRRWPRLPVALAAAVIWTGLEVFRGEIAVYGYPWLLLAHPLIAVPALAQPAAALGTYFVSFLATLAAGVAAELCFVRPVRPPPVAAGGALLVVGFVAIPLLAPSPAPVAGTFRIGVVQTNIRQDNKLDWTLEQRLEDFSRFLDLTREAAAAKPDLIVWPETMFPGAFLAEADVQMVRDAEARLGSRFESARYFAERLSEEQARLGIPMLVGALGYDHARLAGDSPDRVSLDFDHRYNSVFLLSGGRVDPARYDKIALTPFGEVMPYVNAWPWLQDNLLAIAAGGMAFDLSPGRGPHNFRIPSSLPDRPEVSVATPICFEATKPALSRRLLRDEGTNPRVIVNLTNDGWFGNFDPGRLQHLQIARWRAVELATPVVRVANTGVSTWIDSRGRIVKRGVDGNPAGFRTDGVLIADVAPGRGGTIYSRIGDVFGWSAMGLTATLVLLAVFKPRTAREPTVTTGPA